MLEEIITMQARLCLSRSGGIASIHDVADSIMEDFDQTAAEPHSNEHVLDLLRHLGSTDGPLMVVGELLADLTLVTEDLVFTHRLTAHEVDSGELALDRDLAVLARIATTDGGLHLTNGEPLHYREVREAGTGLGGSGLLRRTLSGPEGWLGSLTAGALLQVTPGEGLVAIAPAPTGTGLAAEAGGLPPEVDLLADIAEAMDVAHGGDGSPVFVEEVQAAGLVLGWYQPTRNDGPFSEVLESAGFELSGAWVGQPGGWEAFAVLSQRIGLVARHVHHLRGGDTKGVADFVDAFRSWQLDETVVPEARVLSRLGRSPDAALCVEEEVLNVDPSGLDLGRFLLAFERPKGPLSAALDTLRALAADLADNGAEAESLLEAAALAAPEWYPALEGQVFFRDLRGRGQDAVNLLQRIRMPDDEELAMTRRRARAGTAMAGRNDPCPCGSGRKFKQCHQGKNALPPEVRVTWLLDKARSHLARVGPLSLTDDLLTHRAGMEHSHLIAIDVALFDRGALAAFLSARRDMLPVEEVALLEGWVSGHRPSVYRVSKIDGPDAPGGIVLTDQATGTNHLVHRTAAFSVVKQDDLAWCRLLPEGDRWWCSGIVRPAQPDEVEMLIAVAGDSQDLCRGLAGLLPTVRMLATDGEPLMNAIGCWRLTTDQATAEALLDGVSERHGDNWIVTDEHGIAITMNLVASAHPSAASPEMAAVATDLLSSLAEDGPAAQAEADPHEGWVRVLARTDSVARHRAAIALIETVWPDVPLEWEQTEPIARHRALLRQEALLNALEAEQEAMLEEAEAGWARGFSRS